MKSFASIDMWGMWNCSCLVKITKYNDNAICISYTYKEIAGF